MQADADAFEAPAIPYVPGTQLVPVHAASPKAAQEPGEQAAQVARDKVMEPLGPTKPAGQAVPLHVSTPPAL